LKAFKERQLQRFGMPHLLFDPCREAQVDNALRFRLGRAETRLIQKTVCLSL
jgi:hypothetical protein